MTTIQVRKKGQFTIPIQIREELGIQENDTVTVGLVGQAMIVIPQKLKVQALLQETAAQAQKRGITLETLLAELDEIRHQS